jgi:hypothetical protein
MRCWRALPARTFRKADDHYAAFMQGFQPAQLDYRSPVLIEVAVVFVPHRDDLSEAAPLSFSFP